MNQVPQFSKLTRIYIEWWGEFEQFQNDHWLARTVFISALTCFFSHMLQ